MDVYFSTVVRGAPPERGGELVRVDWESKRVLGRVPIVPRDPWIDDPNPRGSSRGGRGILIRDGELLVANYHSLLRFDRELRYRSRITGDLFVGLHELAQTEDRIWLASTSIDAALAIDDAGTLRSSWWPRERPEVREHLDLEPLEIDKEVDNRLRYLDESALRGSHTHLNAVAVDDGRLYALLNRYGVVWDATAGRPCIEHPGLVGAHNLLFLGERSEGGDRADRIVVNDTRGKRVLVFDRAGRLERAIELLRFREVARLHRRHRPRYLLEVAAKKILGTQVVARPIFVRGLAHLGGERVLVGLSPATILEIDIGSGRLLDLFQDSTDVRVCPHGIAVASGPGAGAGGEGAAPGPGRTAPTPRADSR